MYRKNEYVPPPPRPATPPPKDPLMDAAYHGILLIFLATILAFAALIISIAIWKPLSVAISTVQTILFGQATYTYARWWCREKKRGSS